jgi:hypothetical protein
MNNENAIMSPETQASQEEGNLKDSDVANTQYAAEFPPADPAAILNAELETDFSRYCGHMFKAPLKFHYPNTIEKISNSATTLTLFICERYDEDEIQPRFIDIHDLVVPERFKSRVKVVEFRLGLTFDLKPRLVYRIPDSFKHRYDTDQFLEYFVYSIVEDIHSQDQWQSLFKTLDKNWWDPELFNNLQAGIV